MAAVSTRTASEQRPRLVCDDAIAAATARALSSGRRALQILAEMLCDKGDLALVRPGGGEWLGTGSRQTVRNGPLTVRKGLETRTAPCGIERRVCASDTGERAVNVGEGDRLDGTAVTLGRARWLL